MRRGAGSTAAVLVIAGVFAVGYPAGAKPEGGHHTQRLARALKKCEQDKSKRRREKCEKTAKARYKSNAQTGGRVGTGTGTGTGIGTSTGTGTTGTATAPPPATGAGTTGTPEAPAMGTTTGGGTTGTPEARSATLIVHVYESYALACTPEQAAKHQCEPSPDEGAQLRISRLGSTNEVASTIETSEHTVHVAPGRYEVALTADVAYKPQQVTVTAGQTHEVTIEIQRK